MEEKRLSNRPVPSPRIELLVGLYVVDDDAYDEYRREMEPMLRAMGGGFGYDFRIKETLRSDSHEPINRVFTIYFPTEQEMSAFFEDAKYREIKARHFERSVAATTILAKYRRTANAGELPSPRVTE